MDTDSPHKIHSTQNKPDFDPARCPLCSASNECAMVQSAEVCWCYFANISETVLDRIPLEARGIACICRGCANPGALEAEK